MKVRKHSLMKRVCIFALFAFILSIGVLHGGAAAKAETVPDLDIDMPESINIGESLTITVNNAENVTLQEVRAQFDIFVMGSVSFTDNTVVIPDHLFEIGENLITIIGKDPTTNETFNIEKTVHVLGNSPAPGPTISAAKDNVNFGEPASFTIFLSGAERFAYQFISYVGSQRKSHSRLFCYTAENQITVDRISSYANSRMVFRAKAYVNGAWTAYSEYEVSVNEAPKLDKPEFTAPSLVLVDTPIELTIQPVEHAEKYTVAIYQNGSALGGNSYDAAGTYVLDYQPPVGSYEIAVYVTAAGYERSDYSWSDLDIVTEFITGPKISSSETEFEINNDAIFTIAKKGATQFRIHPIILQSGVAISDYDSYILDATDGSVQDSLWIKEEWAGAILEIHAQAKINNQWTKETVLQGPIVREKTIPKLNTPSLTVPSSPMEAGTPVYVTIGEVDNATYYRVEVDSDTNPSIIYRYHLWSAGTCELQGLAEAGDYSIRVYAGVYDGSYAFSDPATAAIELVGAVEDGPALSCQPPWIAPEKYFYVSASLDGAERFYATSTIIEQDGRIRALGYSSSSFVARDGAGSCAFRTNNYIPNGIVYYNVYISAFRNGKWTRPSMIQVAVNDTDQPVLTAYDFTLPTDLITIEASAFENANATAVYIPDTCTAISANAFKGNAIQQLRLPRDCDIDSTAFDDTLLTIVAPAGGSSETWATKYASTHSDCTYYPE